MIVRSALAAFFVAALGLGLLVVSDANLAGRPAAEDGMIEWSQAALCLMALVLSLTSALKCYRTGRPIVLDVADCDRTRRNRDR
jgi:hypothetical protein